MSSAPLDVVVVGNAGIDTNVYFQGNGPDFTVESNYTENLDCIGQAGGYSARGFARLGHRTGFIGAVGDDFSGRHIRQALTDDGIDLGGLFTDPTGTGRSVNFMYPDGRRKNFYDGKGHMNLRPDLELCRAMLSRARLAHFSIPNWARGLLPLARELGLTIACDVQDVVDIDDPYRRDFVASADILFCSSVNFPDPTPLIEAFRAKNPAQMIVVGMGAQGCALGHREGIEFFGPVSLPDPVVDTNGAGDGLAVGFLSSYVLDGYPPQQAIRRGQIAARHTCTLKATSHNLITRQQLEETYARP